MQDAEERSLAALQDKAGNKRLAELRKALLSKEHKMRALREALVKLKQVRHDVFRADPCGGHGKQVKERTRRPWNVKASVDSCACMAWMEGDGRSALYFSGGERESCWKFA